MKQKTSERFTDVMIELAKISAKLDAVLELTTRVKVLEAYVDTQLKEKYHPFKQTIASTGCLICGKYDCPAALTNLPCPKGTPYALSSGSLGDSGTAQVWYNQGTDFKLPKLGDDVEE